MTKLSPDIHLTLQTAHPVFSEVRSYFLKTSTMIFFIASFQGNVFRYNYTTDKFESIPEKLPPSIEFGATINGKLIMGAADGVWESTLDKDGGIHKPTQILKIPFVSYIKAMHDGKYFIATRTHQHFIADTKQNKLTPIVAEINNVNHVYESDEHDLWISSNEGLVMMREDLFEATDEKVSDFIESITQDLVSGKIYYAIYSTMYAFDPATKINTKILDLPSGYFQSLVATPEGIWVANAFRVFLFSEGKIKKQFDFSDHGRFITGLFQDSKKNIWLIIPGVKQAYLIDNNLQLQRFNIPLHDESLINVIREGKDGMYIGSNGVDNYLFFKSYADSVFHNISAPLQFPTRDDFNVPDFTTIDNDIWLASSEGLLKYSDHKTERVNLGDNFTGLPVRTIYRYPDKKSSPPMLLG